MALQVLNEVIAKGKSLIPFRGVSPQGLTQFIRTNPLTSAAVVSSVVGGGVVAAQVVRSRVKRKRKSKVSKRRKTKARRANRRKKSRKYNQRRRCKKRIIRGKGIGCGEIRHSGRKTRTRLIQFRTKSGKMVRFRVRRR